MEEKWKDIEGFNLYEASTFGNIRNKNTNQILKQFSITSGYLYLGLIDNNKIRKMYSVHRIIAKTFIPNNDNKPTVNHKDHNPSNNNVTNLEWASYSEQAIHKRKPSPEIYDYTGTRPVWRICQETNNKLQKYNSIKDAAKWVFDNNLTKVTEFGSGGSIKTTICAVIRRGKTNGKDNCKNKFYERKTAYGYKWEYDDENETIFKDEVWKDIPFDIVNFKGYSISSYGRVKNNKGRITTGYSKEKYYITVNVYNKEYYIHRLVALAFIPNPENKKNVNHKDGNKQNPKMDNLEWVNNSENSKHAVSMGKILTKPVIQYDLNNNKINEFNSIKIAAEYLNISKSMVANICNKKYKRQRQYTLEWKLYSS